MARYSWAAVEQALPGRPGWRRRGREWRGPCPITGLGKDTCWAKPADYIADGVLIGCHRCHPWTRYEQREHLDALAPDARREQETPARPKQEPGPKVFRPSKRIIPIWSSGQSPAGTAAERYLRNGRCCWLHGALPPSVRWLDASHTAFPKLRPLAPENAAGVVLYAYRGVHDRLIGGLQMEAVSQEGRRIRWPPNGAPRVSLAGSLFDRGRQRFEAQWRGSDAPLFLVEGPTSALAAMWHLPDLRNGWTVAGSSGWAGFSLGALGRAREVWVFPDGDEVSRKAARELHDTDRGNGREMRVETVPDGSDLLDLWRRSQPGGTLPPVVFLLPGTAGRAIGHEARR